MVQPLINDANIQLQQFYKAFGKTERSEMMAEHGFFRLGEVLEKMQFTEGEIDMRVLSDMLSDLRFIFYQDGNGMRKYVYSYGDFVLLRGLTSESDDYDFYRAFLDYDKFRIYREVIEDVTW